MDGHLAKVGVDRIKRDRSPRPQDELSSRPTKLLFTLRSPFLDVGGSVKFRPSIRTFSRPIFIPMSPTYGLPPSAGKPPRLVQPALLRAASAAPALLWSALMVGGSVAILEPKKKTVFEYHAGGNLERM